MTNIKRLGLGCMGMNMSNIERSVETVRYALDHGVTLFNTGEFYGGGESEMVLREALKGVPRDSYFLSVKSCCNTSRHTCVFTCIKESMN